MHTRMTIGVVLAVLSAQAAQGYERRVPPNFFGINGQRVRPLTLTSTTPGYANDAMPHLEAMAALGLEIVRADATWRVIEPTRPTLLSDLHEYSWTAYDQWVESLAEVAHREARHAVGPACPVPGTACASARRSVG